MGDDWSKRAAHEYASRKKAAEKQVVRWEYASKQDRSVEPLWFERHPEHGRGRRLEKLPKPTKYGNMAYGLDAEGRCVVERMYVGPKGYKERFLVWSEHGLEWVLYEADHRPAEVCRAQLADGDIVGYVSQGVAGGWTKTFDHLDDGRVRVQEEYTNPNGTPGGRRDLIITPREPKNERLQDLLPPLEEELIREIPRRVPRLKEPAYCLVISFPGKGNDMFPPHLGIGLERDRRRVKSDFAEVLWDPADWEHHDRVEMDCARVNLQIARQEAWSQGYDSYARIAAELRKLDWREHLPITDDFVVFAVDFDDTHLMRNLKQAAGARRFAAWKKLGWVR